MTDNLCPCGSQKPYKRCCARYILGTKPAPIAEALMRSRYTAYTLGKVDYLLETWAQQTRDSVNSTELAQSCQQTKYLGLKIISKNAGTRKHTVGQVEFEVKFESLGKQQTHRELSNFIKKADKWFYVDGDVRII